MNYKIISCLTYLFGIIILTITLLLEYKKYGEMGAKKYSFLKNFPFELNSFRRHNVSTYIYLVLKIFASFLFSVSYLFIAFSFGYISTYILFAIFTFSIIAINILEFINFYDYKLHVVFDAICVGLNLLFIVLTLYYFLDSQYWYITKSNVKIVEVILLLLLVGFEALLLFNKSYKDWYKKIEFNNIEGSEKRKISYLPSLEWGNILILILMFIPYLIMMFF